MCATHVADAIGSAIAQTVDAAPTTFPKDRETPAEHIRHAIMYLMNPHYESHGTRIFTVEQIGDVNRLLWRAVNVLEGRADP
jgi:hypothetical protein